MFKPKLIPTLFTIPAIITLLALGTWQVKRLEWKNNLIAAMTTRISMPAIDMPESIDDINNYKYRKIRLSGNFMNENEIHLFTGPIEMKGEPGYEILTPFEQDGGNVVLVDRGWVPASKKNRNERPETISDEPVTVYGMLLEGEKQARFVPDNDIAGNLWFWIDVPAIAAETGYNLQNLYIRLLKSDNDVNSLPITGDAVVKYRNDHLQYAIIWYSLAIILLVIYILFHYRRED